MSQPAEPVAAALEALDGLRRLMHLVMADTWSEWAHLDVSMAQVKAIFALHEAAGLTVSGLAERLGTKPPATSILVDRLVHQGLVRRTEDLADRRRARLSLSEEGRSLVGRLRQGRSRMEEWVAALGPAELAALTAGIRALVRAAEAPAAPVEAAAERRVGG